MSQTAVTSAPRAFASCTAAVPIEPEAPNTATRSPSRTPAAFKQAFAMLGPSESAAASSKLIPAGMCASAPCSRTQTSSALAPDRSPNTRSPTSNSVTPSPTSSTMPASSVPTIRCRGARRPVKTREKNGWAAR